MDEDIRELIAIEQGVDLCDNYDDITDPYITIEALEHAKLTMHNLCNNDSAEYCTEEDEYIILYYIDTEIQKYNRPYTRFSETAEHWHQRVVKEKTT